MKISVSILLLFLFSSFLSQAQKMDTVLITSQNINRDVLSEGTHRYLVYFKMGKDAPRSETQFWTRKLEYIDYNGSPALQITQEWEDKDSIMHTVKSISDGKTMQPLYHKTWWKFKRPGRTPLTTESVTVVDFVNKTVEHNGRRLSDSDTSRQAKTIWEGYKSSQDRYFLNWHLDLETFPLLPYEQGTTFIIPFYDPGTASNFQNVAYTVTGSALLDGYDNQKIDCWLLIHEEDGNREVFWISKKTKEVLKLEQEINGSFYRYKIKLGFSS